MSRIVPLCLLAAVASRPAAAINYFQLQRSHSLTYEKLEDAGLKQSLVNRDYDYILMLGASYMESPLKIRNLGTGAQEDIVKSFYSVNFGAGYNFNSWFAAGVGANYVRFADNNDESHAGISDPELQLKFRVVQAERFGFALIPFTNFGLSQGKYVISGLVQGANMNGIEISPISDRGQGYGMKAAFEWGFRRFQVVSNLGYRFSPAAKEADVNGRTQVDYRHTLLTGLGGYVPLGDRFGGNIEFNRVWRLDQLSNTQSLNELYVGAGMALTTEVHLFSGIGIGSLLARSLDKDYRVTAGLKIINPVETTKTRRVSFNGVMVDRETESRVCEEPKIFGDTNVLTIRFFKNDSGVMKDHPDLTAALSRLAENLALVERIEIVGHASFEGPADLNAAISRRRSESVAERLREAGIPDAMMELGWRGAGDPLESRVKSRRVAVVAHLKRERLCREQP